MIKCYKCIHKSVCIDDANYKYAENCNRYVGGNDEMRNYQRTKNNPYKLPQTLYRRMIDLVRDYERIKQQCDDIINGTPEHDEVTSSSHGNPTESKAIRLANLRHECEAVEKALSKIPKEYHQGIMNNIIYYARYPYTAGERTYGYQKSRFIYFIAENLNLI